MWGMGKRRSIRDTSDAELDELLLRLNEGAKSDDRRRSVASWRISYAEARAKLQAAKAATPADPVALEGARSAFYTARSGLRKAQADVIQAELAARRGR